jgi:hypothetical protein
MQSEKVYKVSLEWATLFRAFPALHGRCAISLMSRKRKTFSKTSSCVKGYGTYRLEIPIRSEGHLILFDRDPHKSCEEKISHSSGRFKWAESSIYGVVKPINGEYSNLCI